MRSTLKKIMTLIVCVMLVCTACGNANRSKANSVANTTEVATEPSSAETESTTETITEDQILEKIDQYKADYISGNWDGSPKFVGGNVISIDENSRIWLNNRVTDEPLYCKTEEGKSFYPLDEDDTFMYYYMDVESETEERYFILQVNKQTGDNIMVEVPEETYSAKLVLGNIFVRGEYSLYRIDFTSDTPEALLMEECISDFEVKDYYYSVELHYVTGERLEAGIRFDKESGEEKAIEPRKTTKARYSDEEGELTFYDNELYSKARELYGKKWYGDFIDLHTLDSEIEENTYASVDYNDNIVINNEIQGRYFRAIQVEPGCNVCGTYYGPELVWFEDEFIQYLRFYFPNQEEEYCLHSYGTDLPFEIGGYTRMLAFYYGSDLVAGKTAGSRVYLLTDGELWILDCNFVTEQVKTHVIKFDDAEIVDFNWAYNTLYYMLENGEVYTIKYGQDDWDFDNPSRFGGDKVFFALSHHTDEREGALSFNEGNYGDTHLYSPYGENW